MIVAHDLLTRSFDLLLGPLDRWTPTAGLWAVSALSGVAVLFVFRWASNAAAIRATRRRAQAELLAVRLYRDNPRVVLRAQARFLAALARYLGHMLVPFSVLLLPFALICAQLDARYGARALQPEERAIVEAFGTSAMLDSAELQSADGIVIETGPVRIAERGEMSWRVAAKAPGRQFLTLVVAGGRVDKEVVVAAAPRGAPTRRMSSGVSSFFLAPAEAAIEDGLGVRRIEVRYPPLEIDFLGWKTGWITVFLVVSGTVALALRRRMGVEL
ncbi:MAG: hypothetical protein ABW298_11040 [Candidatus Binatia bacterium]